MTDRPALIISSRQVATLLSGCIVLAGLCSWPTCLFGDDTPPSAGYRPRTFAVTNAKIVVAPGQVIEKGNIVVRDGRVVTLGLDAAIPADAVVIEADGLHLYPGFIDAGASALFNEFKPQPVEGRGVDISRYALAGMRSDDRNGLTPEFVAAEHLKPQQGDLDKYRQAGFVAVHVLPSGRIASGQGAVVNLASLPTRTPMVFTPDGTSLIIQAARSGKPQLFIRSLDRPDAHSRAVPAARARQAVARSHECPRARDGTPVRRRGAPGQGRVRSRPNVHACVRGARHRCSGRWRTDSVDR